MDATHTKIRFFPKSGKEEEVVGSLLHLPFKEIRITRFGGMGLEVKLKPDKWNFFQAFLESLDADCWDACSLLELEVSCD